MLENFPDVPVTEFFDCRRLAVYNIECRLLKLKFFKKTWCEEPSDQTESEKEVSFGVVISSKPKRKVEMMKDAPTTKKKLISLMTGTYRQLASFPQLPRLLSTLNPRLSKTSAPLIPGQSSRLRLGLRLPTLTRNLLLRQVSTWTRRWMTVAPRICPAPAPGTCLMGPPVSTATSTSTWRAC